MREATFNALGSLGVVQEAAVLDLFAGSGAMGIEALSRGAARATFVDHDIAARRAIEANLAACGLTEAAEVVAAPAERFLAGAGQQRRWDLALLDPPYDYDGWPELLLDLPAHTAVLEGPKAGRPAVRVGGRAGEALRAHPRGDRPAHRRLSALTCVLVSANEVAAVR